LNSIVCIKPVTTKNNLDRKGINEIDLNAIEEAIRLKEKLGGKTIGITMGTKLSEVVLKKAMSLGIDETVLVTDNKFAGSDTNATAYVLSKTITKIKQYDLIICGNNSSDSATGQVGIELANKLSIPFAINVIEVKVIDDKTIECKSITEFGTVKTILKLPALITVLKDINVPRIPTIKQILESQNKNVKKYNSEDIETEDKYCGLIGSPTKVISTFRINNRKKECKIIEGTIDSKVNKILEIIRENQNINANNNEETFEENNNSDTHKIWIYAEENNGEITKNTLELLGKGRELADKSSSSLEAIIVTNETSNLDKLIKYGADKVYCVNSNTKNYCSISKKILKIIKEHNPQIFLLGKTFYGKIIAAYVASELNTGLSADCIDLDIDDDKKLIQKRVVYNGELMANIICPNTFPQMATISSNIFKTKYNKNHKGDIFIIDDDIESSQDNINVKEINYSNEENIEDAKFIIAAGGGVKTQESFEKLQKLANNLKAKVGVTRRLVDLGFSNYKYQIGQSGKTVDTNLYIACGISGASEHILGVNSKIVLAINNNPKAPIFDIADYGVIEDVDNIIPILMEKIKEEDAK